MRLIFLGTGTSTGVPQLNCNCEVCRSTDPADSRMRASAIVEVGGKNILIDCGPDFREQMLRFHRQGDLDALLVRKRWPTTYVCECRIALWNILILAFHATIYIS